MSRVGVRLPQPHEEPAQDTVTEYAKLADREGIDSVWFSESYGRNQVPGLTQAAAETDSVNIGAGVINIYSRSPALVAMTAADLAERSDGRFVLGLGASGPAVIENFHGIPFESPLRRTREYIEIVREYLSGDRIEYDGSIFELSGFALDPECEYDVPIYTAALGETNRRLTGEFADGWLPFLVPLDGLPAALEAVEEGASRQDRSLSDITVSPFVITCVSSDDPEKARNIGRKQFSFYVSAMGEYYYRVVSEQGYADEADAIRSAWNDGNHDQARANVTEDVLDAFTLTGSPEAVRDRLEQYYDAGADEPIANLPARYMSQDMIEETIRNLVD